jgi:hypothetical protein
MSASLSKFAVAVGILPFLFTSLAQSQSAVAALSGIVTSVSGAAVAGAKVSIRNLNTGETADTQTDSTGSYNLPSLSAGDYELSVTAEGFDTKVVKVTVTGGAGQTNDFALTAAQPQNPAAPTDNLPNAPSSSKTEPSLEDLGFPKEASQGDAKQQALLDKRTHMLKVHQKLGLITTIPLVAAIISSAGAGGKQTSTSSRWLHVGLGAAAGDMYFTTAYFAIFAPKIQGTPTKGPIRVHKALAWIHGPGMILTPILGTIAYDQKSRGEKVHGLGAAHMPVALVTAGAYGAALLAVSVKF